MVLRYLGSALSARLPIRQLGLLDSGRLLRTRLGRATIALFGTTAGARGPWSAPTRVVEIGDVEVSILDEDGGELLAVYGLIRVAGRFACIAEPALAESSGELGGDAVLIPDVQGPVPVGGHSAPARIRVRLRSA